MKARKKSVVVQLEEKPAEEEAREAAPQLMRPFLFRMGPLAVSITCVVLVALMAVLYLTQLGWSFSLNQQFQSVSLQQQDQQREVQDLLALIAQKESPAYIQEQATKEGLVPADPKNVKVIVVSGLQPAPAVHRP